MPRVPLHALIWSRDQSCYTLYKQDQLVQQVQPGDEAAWLSWLREVSSFAFHGTSGNLNVYLEARSPGGLYWYAYHTSRGRTRKRYLGQTENLSLARLEETARTLVPEPEVVQALDQGMTLLSSRLVPPRRPTALVERERLLTALDEVRSTSLTLVSAPAGFGKTTLLSVWAHRQKTTQVAWLSLDELDNSPARFWVALIAALRLCPDLPANVGENVVAQLQSPQPPPLFSCLAMLLHELENQQMSPIPIVLVLDDYQVIEAPAIQQGMAFFLEHLPAHLHLILSSRVDPDLPLARLRAHGQLTEIRAAELRFQEGEAHQFLDQMLSPPLSEEEVQRLVSRTEGWIVGLHLVAITMQKRKDRTAYLENLTGSQRYLLDYVQEDILARLSPETHDFLLHTAILSRLDAAVCQAVTAAPTKTVSQHMLTLLERANLFLVPLDEERRTYRLHELFREALLSALHISQPEMVPLLHRRAASFYEAQEQRSEAIAHRLLARDFSAAARLMEQTVEQFWVRGEAATMANWVLALPQPLVRTHARLQLTTALYLLNTATLTAGEQRARVHAEVQQLMARVESALRAPADETSHQLSAPHADAGAAFPLETREAHAVEEALLQRRLRLLRLFLVLIETAATGENERLSSRQQEIQEELEQDEEIIWQMVPLACSFILHYTIWQAGASLVPRLLEAKGQASREASPFASLKVRQWLALAAVEAGRLRLASEESVAALGLIERMAGYTLLKGYFEIVLAQVWYQWNRLEEARSLLHAVVHDAAAWQHLDLLGWGYADLLQIALATGDQSEALLALHEVEQLVLREHFATYSSWLPTMRARWWLVRGQLKEASEWAAGVVFPKGVWDGGSYAAFAVVMRVYFAEHRIPEALELLKRWRDHLDRPANIAITITYLAQLLVALHQAGESEQASIVAARLFALTEPEGYLRVYLDEGEPMREALLAWLTSRSQHQHVSSTTAYVSRLVAAFEQGQGASRFLEEVPTSTSALGASLTRREQEVLRLMAAGASNQDIARTLVVSVATVKKHVSNLLGKLGVTSRTQAIAQAHARSLL